MKKEDLKILLIQIRKDAMKEHEYECLVKKSGLRPDQLVSLDVFEKLPKVDDLEGFDALFIGGSGAYCLSEGEIPKEIKAIEKLVLAARKKKMPILGMCFGAHAVTDALGGTVVHDLKRQEVGTFDVFKRAEAELDPLFKNFPKVFHVVLGHKDHVEKLPSGAVRLIENKRSPLQAYTFPGEPIYVLQFHPELDKEDLIIRVDFYRDLYLAGGGNTLEAEKEFDEIKENAKPTPEAAKLVALFIDEIVLAGKRYPQKSA